MEHAARRTFLHLLGLGASLVAGLATAAEEVPPTPQAVMREARRSVLPDGIEKAEAVRIGGIDQWISVRGRHRDNPLLLFLHGGPGFTALPTAYFYQGEWEEYFTVAHWDQRGAGKTYALNPPEAVRPTMTMERMVADAEEVVEHLRKTYGKKRIVLVGHSWGSILGVKLAQRHPEWFDAYVGIGQAVDVPRNEALGYEATLQAARADGNAKAVAELEALAPFPDPKDAARQLVNLPKERRWLSRYESYNWRDPSWHGAEVWRFSPDVSDPDMVARDAGLDLSFVTLWGAISQVDFRPVKRFALPVVFFHGRHDLTTSARLLDSWYATLQAPSKKLVWFEDSAHMVHEEEPGKVLVRLVQDVLPLTRRK
ncbi:alpha/beta hydrolase [Corallococcus sp. BB11-1]|uniref:alpha/beta fold hydrolase n=1 Tax=Corallococcus sp. BB11-1 TaxID=2996783 RepID=UPI0010E351CF|nr:alpha/beta hydrolase [Corallococcus sp. BB11-1]MCY1034968.1 alpha/beta hydrolase [Corallococcus sp. BB11-1]RYZ46406.1 MAG: alpha/beta hydrolase [Myxococcaceae bacterium]